MRFTYPILALTAILAAWGCRDAKKPNNGKPALQFSARNGSGVTGDSLELSWSSINSTHCQASGDWSGPKELVGNQRIAAAKGKSRFTLSCHGMTGSTSKSVNIENGGPGSGGPVLRFTADYLTVESGGRSTLSWTSENATACRAEGDWSGTKPLKGRESTPLLSRSGVFILRCDGEQGTVLDSVKVSIGAPALIPTGLNFPSNGETSDDIRFAFTGENLVPMYPAAYIWRVNLRRQAGYYTTFFWGPDGAFTGTSYYGCHPYPDGNPKPASRAHKWELSIDREDFTADVNGHSTQLGYDTWKTQALRVYDDGFQKVHEFYWDLPDTTKVIRQLLPRSYGTPPHENPALTFGDAPWAVGAERLSGILRGIRIYAQALSVQELLAEAVAPLSTPRGAAHIWYLNLDPTPDDISDKSGRGHHPEWVGRSRAGLWTGPESSR